MSFLRIRESVPLAALDRLAFSRLRRPIPFHGNVQVMDLFSEGVPVQA